MCQLLALPLRWAFLQWPLTVLTRQTWQAVHAINQSILLRCLWFNLFYLQREFFVLVLFCFSNFLDWLTLPSGSFIFLFAQKFTLEETMQNFFCPESYKAFLSLSLSFSLIPLSVLPVLISHKYTDDLMWGYHCNKLIEPEQIFHLGIAHNRSSLPFCSTQWDLARKGLIVAVCRVNDGKKRFMKFVHVCNKSFFAFLLKNIRMKGSHKWRCSSQ